MYKIITSDGDIYFNVKDGIIERVKNCDYISWYREKDAITFINDDDVTKEFIKSGSLNIISNAKNQYFLTKEVNYCGREYDDSYILEYLMVSKEEWEKEEQLKQKIEKLKRKIQKYKYQPGGPGYLNTLDHFETIKNQQ